MRNARVWFNKGLSNLYDALRLVRDADTPGELTLLASHTSPDVPVLTQAHEWWLEPEGALDDMDYVAWCLEICRTRSVDLFIPGRRREAMAQHRNAFAEIGTRLSVTADPITLSLIEHKDEFYGDLVDTEVPIPEYRFISGIEEFNAAYADLRTRYPRLCVKPSQGMFGTGFRIIVETGDPFDLLVNEVRSQVRLDAFRAALADTKTPRRLLLMRYLEGEERSVDCVAVRGRLASAVGRVKRGGVQVTETEGPTIEIARYLTERYALDGIFNLQTKASGGVEYLLEINSRMSGGLLYACMAGVCLPYWAIRLALDWDTADAVPAPQSGVRIVPVQGAIAIQAKQYVTSS